MDGQSLRGPAYGPRVDVVQLTATSCAPVLIAITAFEELALAVPHSSWDGSVSPAGTRGILPKIEETGTM